MAAGVAAGPIKRPNATGKFPTGTVATTVLVAVSITETVLLPLFEIYANG
jgi:hypothetical protein